MAHPYPMLHRCNILKTDALPLIVDFEITYTLVPYKGSVCSRAIHGSPVSSKCVQIITGSTIKSLISRHLRSQPEPELTDPNPSKKKIYRRFLRTKKIKVPLWRKSQQPNAPFYCYFRSGIRNRYKNLPRFYLTCPYCWWYTIRAGNTWQLWNWSGKLRTILFCI